MSDLGNKEIIARNILFYMDRNGITRQDLCDRLGFKYSTVSAWINREKYPRIDKIEMMANFFRISKADLVEDKTKLMQCTSPVPQVAEKAATQTLLEKMFADDPEMLADVKNISIQGKLFDNDGAYELSDSGLALIKMAIVSAVKEAKEKRLKEIETRIKDSELYNEE